MEQWKIVKDRAKCTQSGCPLGSTLEYIAVLELPSCVRRDLCERCFADRVRQEGEPLYWRGRRRHANKGPTLDLASLRQLFDRLGEVDGADPEKAATAGGLRYLVALLLLRKRVLKMVDAETEADEAADLVVVDPKVDGMRPVALFAPELDTERLSTLKDELLAAIEV